jgi:hypothetical protein
VSALAIAAAALVTSANLDLEIGARWEGRTSTVSPSPARDATRATMEASPRATLSLDGRSARAAARYAPTLRTGTADTDDPAVFHDGELRAAWSLPRLEFTGRASAVRAASDPLANPVALETPTPVATLEPLQYRSLLGELTAAFQAGPRTRATAIASLGADEGADAHARELLPPQRQIEVAAGLERRMTPRDELLLRVSTRGARTGSEAAAGWATATATLRHLHTPRVETRLGAGAAFAREERRGRPPERSLLPVFEAAVAREPEHLRDREELIVRARPAVDRFTGETRPEIEATALGWVRVAPTLVLSALGTGAVSARDAETALALANGSVRWAPRPWLAVEAGLRARWQHDGRSEQASFVDVGTFLAIEAVQLRR